MVFSTGVDIEDVQRFKPENTTNHFLNLIFTKKEISYCTNNASPAESLAGKFCAKEAIIKALKKKIAMKNIEILNDNDGSVLVYLHGSRKKNILCSISHTNKYAIAFVLIL